MFSEAESATSLRPTMPRYLIGVTALAALLYISAPALGLDRPDIIVADFEGESYLPWVAQGEAFGRAPARGALPGQMAVEGFEGKGLVNSFQGGDDATGMLTSPPFLVERPVLNFLIGGGKYPGETCLDLLVEGRVVRTATGPNDRPGGSERLEWATWNVNEFIGRSAVLRVVDHRKGGWGHINVDQIVQSDRPRGIVPASVELNAERRFLILPVETKASMRRVKITVDGRVARDFDIRLAESEPDFSTFLDLSPFQGKRVEIATRLQAGSTALSRISQDEAAVPSKLIYHEKDRPWFHFTSRRGWLNDPNGLVFFGGEYHLFYQHNPYGWDWGNMHWGHAVSSDLIHWSELPIAIYPREYGDWAFSGSAVVDSENTSGFGGNSAPPLVAAFTSTGRGECVVYSLDRGRTWTEYSGNPVVRHSGRDPRLLWYAPTKRWVMAVYDEEGGRRDIAFYSSPDLKAWTFESRIAGFYECPDLFELPIDGNPGKTLWVLSAADGAYLLGRFDGKTFHPEPGGKLKTCHGNFYAAQTYSNEPSNRRVQIGWAQGITFPDQPFNQQMTIPCELTLRETTDGIRLFANPVAEVDRLRVGDDVRSGFGFPPGQEGSANINLPFDLLDVRTEIAFGAEGKFELELPGARITYDVAQRTLSCNGASARLDPVKGAIRLRMLLDRASIEVFANDGRVAISRGLGERRTARQLTCRFWNEATRVRSLNFTEMGSAWR
jgi:fructan beta-fructosidase